MSKTSFIVRFNPQQDDEFRGLFLSGYEPSCAGSPQFGFPLTVRQALALRDSIDLALEQAVEGKEGEYRQGNLSPSQ